MDSPSLGRRVRRLRLWVYSVVSRSTLRELPLFNVLRSVYGLILSVAEDEFREYKVDGTVVRFHMADHIPYDLPERSVVEDHLSAVEPDDVFYDLGANRGLYTCFIASRLTDGGAVYSYEPSPDAFADLRRNVELNEIVHRVHLRQRAISDEVGTREFAIDPETTGNTLASGDNGGEPTSVETTTLGRVVEDGDEPPTIVKMDIEGQEANAIEAAGDALRRCRLIYCEVHSEALGESVEDGLRALGFDEIQTVYHRSSDNYMMKATNSDLEPAA